MTFQANVGNTFYQKIVTKNVSHGAEFCMVIFRRGRGGTINWRETIWWSTFGGGKCVCGVGVNVWGAESNKGLFKVLKIYILYCKRFLQSSNKTMKPKFTIIGVKDGTRATLNPSSIHEAKLAVQIQNKSRLKSSMQLNGVSLTIKYLEKRPVSTYQRQSHQNQIFLSIQYKNHYGRLFCKILIA